MVIVDEADSMVKEAVRPLFERYVQGPSEQATLVLRSKNWRAGKLDKMVEEVGVIIRCDALNEAQALKWVMHHAKTEVGMPIDEDAAKSLVARIGPSLMHLHSELGKLAAAAGEAKSIHVKLVVEFVGVSREEEAWNIQRSLLSGNAAQALAHLRHVLDVSRQPTPLVMYAVTDLARKLHGLSAGLKSGRAASELARPLKIWGPSGDMLFDVARRVHPNRTLAFLRACVKADERSKTGLTDADRALEMLVVRLQRMLG
jgi:DNA polymerase III delta subunit